MNNILEGSLRGKNKDRRVAGAGSSPVLPTKSKRTQLWKQLRKLDSMIHNISCCIDYGYVYLTTEEYMEKLSKRNKMDAKRKKIRMMLKGYDEYIKNNSKGRNFE